MNNISVIIPCYKEGTNIETTLKNIKEILGNIEIIVSDGSNDPQTKDVCDSFGIVYTIPKKPYRGVNMNHGAKIASGDVLLFVHADTILQEKHTGELLKQLQRIDSNTYGGCKKAFTPNNWQFSLHIWFSNWYTLRIKKEILGDNSLFIHKQLFQKVGGFFDEALFEDVDISARLKKAWVHFTLGSATSITSARKFSQWVIKTLLFMKKCRNWYKQWIPISVIEKRYRKWK